jgi:hypothetical protein
MMGGRVQMRDRMVGDADMRRSHAFLEAITGKYHFPRQPSPIRTGVTTSEDQLAQDVPSKFHRVFSSSQGVQIVSRSRGDRP